MGFGVREKCVEGRQLFYSLYFPVLGGTFKGLFGGIGLPWWLS